MFRRLSSFGIVDDANRNGRNAPPGSVVVKKLTYVLVLASLSLAGCYDQSSSSSGPGAAASSAPSGPGMATLSWEAPTTNTSGGPLMNLSGYRIYYGTDKSDLSQTVSLDTVGMQTYVIEDLGSGTWFFAIKAVTTAGVESALSDVVSKTIA